MTEILPVSYETDVQFLRIAREIAMDLNDIETILKNYHLTSKQWDDIKCDPRFLTLLESEVAAWNTAGNTHERTKLKAGALIEEWLLEANQRIHDPKELLSAKTEVVKLLARIANMGNERGDAAGASLGERFSVTINLGADHKLQFTKTVTPKVIEHEAVQSPAPAELRFEIDEEDPVASEEQL
jgi:hypothetical protein